MEEKKIENSLEQEVREQEAGIEMGKPSETEEGSMEETRAEESCGNEQESAGGREAEDVATLIAAAEQRGYLKGRNESIEELMRRPGMLERMPDCREDAVDVGGNDVMVLSRHRVSIWEKG